MQKKIYEWLDRYFIPTLVSLIVSLGLAFGLHFLFGNRVLTALGGTWGDNFGFYGLILYKDIKQRRAKDEKITIMGMLKVLRNAVVEFGPGEYLDSFVIRPTMMYFIPLWLNNVGWGILIAKILADVSFFLPTIVAYEFRKKIFKD